MKAEHLCICSSEQCQCSSAHGAAVAYLARGWAVIPVNSGEKRPTLPSWKTFQQRLPSHAELSLWLRADRPSNLAIVAGQVSEITVVDLDSAEARRVFEAALGESPCTHIVETPRGLHAYFQYTPGLRTQVKAHGMGLDVRNDGGIAVVPPSVGANGVQYRWIRCAEKKPSPMPTALRALLSSKRLPKNLLRGFEEGERNSGLFKVACELLRSGHTKDEAIALLGVSNRLSSPPLSSKELSSVLNSASQYEPRKDHAGEEAGRCIPENNSRGTGKLTSRILELTSDWDLFQSEGEAFADVCGDVIAVYSNEVMERLALAHFEKTGDVPAKDSLHSAQRILSAKAKSRSSRVLHNRAASIDGELWIDLADAEKRAIRLRASGWEIARKPPMVFRPNPLNQAMFVPVRGGDARLLLDFINLAEPAQGPVLLAWLALSFLDIKYPPLFILGDAKGGKSTLAKMFCRLVDPCSGDLMTPSRERDDFVLNLSERRVSVFDNVKQFGAWESAMLCVASTGGSERRRAKYANREQIVLDIKGPVIVTALDLPTLAADLLDRAITVRLNRLSDESMRDDETLWRRFDSAAPHILGGLLDALAKSEQIVRDVPDLNGVRMTSFAKRGESVCRALGYDKGDFHRALVSNLNVQSKELLHNSAVGSALLTLMETEPVWHGTMRELLATLATCIESAERKAGGWPSAASSLGREVRKLLPLLSHAQISVEFGKSTDHQRTRLATIRYTGLSVRPVRTALSRCTTHENSISGGQTPPSASVSPSVQVDSGETGTDAGGSFLSSRSVQEGAPCRSTLVRTGRTDNAQNPKGVLQ